jgi:hypothetical protein
MVLAMYGSRGDVEPLVALAAGGACRARDRGMLLPRQRAPEFGAVP